MPSADKRARQKENARAAREGREAAVKRQKRRRSVITVGVVVAIFVGVIALLNVLTGDDKKAAAPSKTTTPTTAKLSKADFPIDPKKTYTATVKTPFGNIVMALDTKNAPIAAGHFIKIAKRGFYDDSRWHRVIKGFVIQGGAPDGDPSKNLGDRVVGEVPKGKYALGALAAAKTSQDAPGTFDSQFYIVTGKQGEDLPPDYADFGQVTSGMDVVKKIEVQPVDANGDPNQKVAIEKVTISES